MHTSPAVHAVLWDMDGTLVDTEPYWFRAERELLAAFSIPWSDGQAAELVGCALPETARVLQRAGADLPVRAIVDGLVDSVVTQVRQAVPWRPGARELLGELAAADVPCALVTMSERPLADEIDRLLPTGTFRFLVTGDMVSNGKPHPEPYLRAVEALGDDLGAPLDPARIVAIEDSLPGLASARAAGVVTLGVPNVVPLPENPGHTLWPTLAGRSIADLNDLVCPN
ncbi:haloacid dehalogenase [Rhodococcus ruber Chol-4]|uniref:Hydrolase n=1 Tax=Rhodococcus ruber TaxID=1830 RepID=A0A098BQ82_9NOCA|nr:MULTISPECIES: HAD family phosphatase [Rhodococcus]MDO2379523.1 HAD family phosphatase [Rhodococcus ruber]RIK04152.1 MAG: HAD family phosphatase [Acidobacteriota bacterium]KXF85679.1 haloacid dehalogenase [Rhodococcus ruber Chol-4]MBP2214106.1 HAD superfamily hydrolase (TIGR01509 family) [Rhodococcus ruber]MCD2125231.1 HAD family phosphatase [Rhodococcus ruber]